MSHKAFVTAWRDFGESYLLADKKLVGPAEAWFKVCKGTRWWNDDRMPPEKPVAPPPPKPYKPVKRRPRAKPVKVSVRMLTQIGRELAGWDWACEDDSTFAMHRDREAEFHERIEREIRELEEDVWLTAA